MDMNNRKSETRTEIKGFDIAIEVGCLGLDVYTACEDELIGS
jgi:hypothetical protein